MLISGVTGRRVKRRSITFPDEEKKRQDEISVSHGGEYEDDRLLSSDAALCSLAIDLIMEAADTSETSVNFYQITRRSNPPQNPLIAVRS
jgi:hypothetical protein